ncbi:MAG: serine hydrolase domain-containing protein [Agriterribacter sp.]
MNYLFSALLRTAFIAIIVLFSFNLCGQTIQRIDGSKISVAALTKRVEALADTAKVAGLSITVFNDNRVVYSKQLGYANKPEQKLLTAGTTVYGASFSKAVFAYIVMQLVGEKIIDLDKPLVQYLPKSLMEYNFPGKLKDYRDLQGDERYKKITARMCLDHTTGFPNFRWFEPDGKLRIKFEPGSRVSYSGEGMYLLQLVIQEITGKDFEKMAQERVFIPLGMTNTSYVWQPRFEEHLALGHDSSGQTLGFPRRTAASAAGSMITTPEDYNKFYEALLQQKGLQSARWKEMTTSQIRIRSIQQFGPLSWKDSTLNENIKLGYGLGFGVFQTPYGRGFFKEGHDNGWGHYSIAFPDKKIAIVIMTNSDNGESIFRDLLKDAIGDVYTPWYWENYIPWEDKLNH